MNCPHCDTHIDEHKATHCLDAWVSKVVFGADWEKEDHIKTPLGPIFPSQFSSKIEDAWKIVEKLSPHRYGKTEHSKGATGFRIETHGYLICASLGCYHEYTEIVARAHTAPLAICRAAIKATIND